MTVQTDATWAGPYNPNGIVTVFPFGFACHGEDELAVILDDATVDPALYYVTLNDDFNGGDVVFETAPGGASLLIRSNPVFGQAVQIANQGNYYPAVVEGALDKLAVQILALRDSGVVGGLPGPPGPPGPSGAGEAVTDYGEWVP